MVKVELISTCENASEIAGVILGKNKLRISSKMEAIPAVILKIVPPINEWATL